MQSQRTGGPSDVTPQGILADQSLFALLALVGSRRMDTGAFRRRTGLNPTAFDRLLGQLERESLVDLVSTIGTHRTEEEVVLTERGEVLLLNMLERTCELPELR